MKNMSINTRMFKLQQLIVRYRRAKKIEKIKILDEFCTNFGYNRKYAISLFNTKKLMSKNMKPKTNRGPKIKYNRETLIPILKKIWLASDQACSKKMVAIIPAWLPHYENIYGNLNDDIKNKLLSISHATIDRMLSETRVKHGAKGKSGTKPGAILRQQIPINTNQWDEQEPGYVEADTVAHCGMSLSGAFVWSLTLTDICTGWTELRANFGKSAEGVLNAIENIELLLPFTLKGFDSDNGNEFLNHHLIRYFSNRKNKVQFTRSRPYRKNDNAHVEQKNWSCVRQLIGYDRIENKECVEILNDLYRNEWSLLNNFFIPTMKLTKKQRIGSQIKKIHSKPMTPYERLLSSEYVDEKIKQELRVKYKTLNPFALKKDMEKKLKNLFKFIEIQNKTKKRI